MNFKRLGSCKDGTGVVWEEDATKSDEEMTSEACLMLVFKAFDNKDSVKGE